MLLCDRNCNSCPLIQHENNRLLTRILNEAYEMFGDKFLNIIQSHCPNMTTCFDCGIDDFCHVEGCQIIKK